MPTEPTPRPDRPPDRPTRREFATRVAGGVALAALGASPADTRAAEDARPFGDEFPNLDSLAVGEWWKAPVKKAPPKKKAASPPPPMDVPRDQVVAFALYTVDRGVLKLTAQLYPLKPGEPREARLEFLRDGRWVEAAKSPVE